MYVDIVHGTGACSTIILYAFGGDGILGNDYEQENRTVKGFIQEFQSNCDLGCKFVEDDYGDEIEVPLEYTDFSFVIASTIPYSQANTESILEKLGFKKTTKEPVHNDKNGTHVNFWSISVPELEKAIKLHG